MALNEEERLEYSARIGTFQPNNTLVDGMPFPMAIRTLKKIQDALQRGIQMVAIEQANMWVLPGAQAAFLSRRNPAGKAARFQYGWRLDGTAAILHGVAEHLMMHGERLRSCKKCKKAFLGIKRQEFCPSPNKGQPSKWAQLWWDDKKKRRR